MQPSENPYQAPNSDLGDQTGQHEPEYPTDFAPLWRRGCAFAIDAAIVTACFATLILLGQHLAPDFVEDHLEWSATLAYFAAVAIHIVINLPGWARNGQSLGKRAMGIRIVRKDWEPCSAGRIVFRTLPFLLLLNAPFIGPFIGILDAVLIFRHEPYCLHDDVTDTAVVQ